VQVEKYLVIISTWQRSNIWYSADWHTLSAHFKGRLCSDMAQLRVYGPHNYDKKRPAEK